MHLRTRHPWLRPASSLALVSLLSQLILPAAPTLASMRSEDAASHGQSRLVAPAEGERLGERAARFAYELPQDADAAWLLLGREPFDALAAATAPQGTPGVLRVDARAAGRDLASLGLFLDRETRLYWTVAAQDRASGRWRAAELRTFTALPAFANRVTASPVLAATRTGVMELAEQREAQALRLRAAVVGATGGTEGTIAAPRIRLAAGYDFAPAVDSEPQVPAALAAARIGTIDEATPGALGAYLVQYSSPPGAAEREEIARAGGAVFAYIPDQAFLVRMSTDARRRLEAAGQAAWIGDFQPAFKLSPLADDASVEKTGQWMALLFPDAATDAVRGEMGRRGFVIENVSDNGVNKLVRFRLPANASPRAAEALVGALGISEVAWVEPVVPKRVENDLAQWVVQTFVSGDRRVWTQGIRGQGQVIMTSDSGIDVTHDQFRDPAVAMSAFGDYPTHRKIIGYKAGSNDPAVVFGDHGGANSYHGTHTGCTVAGSDDPVAASTRDGMAKDAKLYFMDLSGPTLANSALPFDDLNDLFLPPYVGNAAGAARLSSNSWGAAVSGQYTLNSQQVDQFMWAHPDFYIAFSNGNSGTVGTVGSPASAKSVAGIGGTRNGTLANSIYASTSRGPTLDGRRKPTFCSPGQSVTSAQAGPSSYLALSGTSMASPSATGAVALIRQYLTDGWYPTGAAVPANGFTPSAALIKAMAINAADNNVTGFSAPDNNIGYGRIKVDNVLYFPGDARRLLLVDQTAGLAQGQFVEYQVQVTDGSIPLEVSLCWTDYPGNPAAAVQLVNNLDLTVSNGVSTYRGNVYSGGFSATGGSADAVNVEEAVLINAPSTGVWTVRVSAPTVPIGPQPFGLVVTGGVGQTAGSLAFDRAEYGSTSSVGLEVVDTNAGSPVNVTVTSPTEPAGVTVAMTGASGVWTGTLQLTAANPDPGDGLLSVSAGDAITAIYSDAAPAGNVVAQAAVSFATPEITNVRATSQGAAGTLVTWNTSTNATSVVHYGLTPALELGTVTSGESRLAHSVLLTGLTPGSSYFYDVESVALNGNRTRDDRGGEHYRFTAKGAGDVLLLVGEVGFPRLATWESALQATRYDYDVWSGPLADAPPLGDATSGLRSYRAVLWQAGFETYPPLSDSQRQVVTDYLGGGGRLAMVGHDIAWAFGDPTSPVYTAARQGWLASTLKTVWQSDPTTWASQVGYAADPISGPYVAGISYEPFRTGGAGDEVDIVASPGGTTAYVWRNNEATPDDVGFRWESSVANGSAGAALWGGQPSRLVNLFFEFTALDPPYNAPSAVRSDVLDRTLRWLFGRDRPTATLTAPNGGEVLGGISTAITWNETVGAGRTISDRTLEYSLDGGDSWALIATGVGPSPYNWDLSSIPASPSCLVRLRVEDDGTPPLSMSDVSNATFTLARPGGDTAGPLVVPGSIAVSPNPIVRPAAASLSATATDLTTGGSSIAAAEWSLGDSPAAPGTGTPLGLGTGTTQRGVSGTLDTTPFGTGPRTLWVRAQDAAGNWGPAASLGVQVNGPEPVAVGDVPTVAFLSQNAPNPFAGRTSIRFGLPRAAQAELALYDVQGRHVRTLLSGRVEPGSYTATWDGRDGSGRQVAAGVYFYALRTDNGVRLDKRLLLLP